MKFRHKFFYGLLRPLVILFNKIKFGYKYEKPKNLPDNYIVLANHATDFDPVFLGAAFPRQMYFVASEHISRWGFAYKLLKFAFAPIIRYKGTVAASTVMDIMRKVRKGANVCIFAEGVRTWDGITCPILPSTAQLVKASRCGLVTYKLTGGYFASPMWSEGNGTRRGYLRGEVSGIYAKEQLASMSVDQVYALIKNDLYEDAYERQLAAPKRYKGRNIAERLENLLFICPKCHGNDTMHSQGDTVMCECGHSFRYDEYGMLSDAEFKTVRDLAAWQARFVHEDYEKGNVYTAKHATLTAVAKGEATPITEGSLSISPEKLICAEKEFLLSSIPDMAIHGKHALVFSTSEGYFELTVSKDSCAYKFLLFFNEHKAHHVAMKDSAKTGNT